MSKHNILKELREARNESQSVAAEGIGITKSALAMYERGERRPRDEVKVKIALYYGKTIEELFF